MPWNRQLVLSVLLLAAAVAVFELADLDLYLQDHFYRGDKQWFVDHHEPIARALFYTGPKACLIGFGVGCGAVFLLSFRLRSLRPHRRNAAVMGLALALIPLGIAAWKHNSNVYCPNQVERYGGTHPYAKAFERFPAGYHPDKRGQGFPCGHSSGGFAMMMLYFVLPTRRGKILGLLGTLALGWAMSFYQILNGEHYLSHAVVTMLTAWIVILLLNRLWPAPSAAVAPAERTPAIESLAPEDLP